MAKVPFRVLVRAAGREYLVRTLAVLREGVEHHQEKLTERVIVIARLEIVDIERELAFRDRMRCGEDQLPICIHDKYSHSYRRN